MMKRYIQDLKKYIKLCIGCPDFKSILRRLGNDTGHRAILIGTPVHSNLGDHMIAVKGLQYISELGYDDVIEVPEFLFELYKHRIQLNNRDTVFITGGGWMGDLYEDEVVLEEMLSHFRNNKIVILPQTIYFDNQSEQEKKKLSNRINKIKDIIVCVRDKHSYDMLLHELFVEEAKCLLLPDIALYGSEKIYPNKDKKYDIGLVFRNDREKLLCMDDGLVPYMQQNRLSYSVTSTVDSKKIIPIKRRNEILANKIQEFSNYSLIITDRLHAMIFAVLAGTKCIAFDNKTHKVRGVYMNCLRDDKNVIILDRPEDLFREDFLIEFFNKGYEAYSHEFEEEYNKLTKKIGDL